MERQTGRQRRTVWCSLRPDHVVEVGNLALDSRFSYDPNPRPAWPRGRETADAKQD